MGRKKHKQQDLAALREKERDQDTMIEGMVLTAIIVGAAGSIDNAIRIGIFEGPGESFPSGIRRMAPRDRGGHNDKAESLANWQMVINAGLSESKMRSVHQTVYKKALRT